LIANLKQLLEETEKKVIENVLQSVGGNKTAAAEVLGIHRTSLYDELRKMSVKNNRCHNRRSGSALQL